MKGATEDEMVGWHHQLNGHEFEQTPGGGEGQGGLACCSPRGHKELNMTELLNEKEFLEQYDRMTEDEMVGWHHQLNGHESEQTPGHGEGHGSLACCSP